MKNPAIFKSTPPPFLLQLSFARDEDDELKSVATGALTGALYKSSAGALKCARGTAFGAALAAAWAYAIKKDERVSSYV